MGMSEFYGERNDAESAVPQDQIVGDRHAAANMKMSGR